MKAGLVQIVLLSMVIDMVMSDQDPNMIRCYHEKIGNKFQECDKKDGFQTCFTKYDLSKFS